jgi:hypothetical protein
MIGEESKILQVRKKILRNINLKILDVYDGPYGSRACTYGLGYARNFWRISSMGP